VVKKLSSLLLALLLLTPHEMPAPYTWKNGWLVDQKNLATLPLDNHWSLGLEALSQEDWSEALNQFNIVLVSFPESSQAKEARYYLGVANFQLDDLDISNKRFNEYLEVENNPKYYEEVFQYKLQIAERLKNGALRRAFGYEKMPKLMTGRTLALEIFDEIATALPNHQLAAQALINKADMLKEREEFQQAIDSYLTLIRRFPKTTFAAQGYVGIAEVHLAHLLREPNNPDPLPLAEINYQKFSQEFPSAPQLIKAQELLNQMREESAKGLLALAEFYSRTKQEEAANIYYKMTISKYPETETAKICYERLGEEIPAAEREIQQQEDKVADDKTKESVYGTNTSLLTSTVEGIFQV
jgi:outer membrane protein assembly factor BamD (BamD/ComL family)